MPFPVDAAALYAFVQVIIVDVVLSGDNAIVIGMAVLGMPKERRGRVIMVGILVATAMRIVFAVLATQLLAIIGLTLAGGLLLLWVVWKMWRELRAQARADNAAEGSEPVIAPPKSALSAVKQIVIADLSMSIDNVLAVAGAAREHPTILVFGLLLSIALMGLAANFIARLLDRYHWIAYVGLAIIAYIAIEMIQGGGLEIFHAMGTRP